MQVGSDDELLILRYIDFPLVISIIKKVEGKSMSIKLRHWAIVILLLVFILMFLSRNIWVSLFSFICYAVVIVYGLIERWVWLSEIGNIGKNQFTIKQRNGKEYVISYNQILFCNIAFARWCLSGGVDLEIFLKQNKTRKTKYFFSLWPGGDILFNKINTLSTKCKIFEVGWFSNKKKKYKVVPTSSKWISFEDRNKE